MGNRQVTQHTTWKPVVNKTFQTSFDTIANFKRLVKEIDDTAIEVLENMRTNNKWKEHPTITTCPSFTREMSLVGFEIEVNDVIKPIQKAIYDTTYSKQKAELTKLWKDGIVILSKCDALKQRNGYRRFGYDESEIMNILKIISQINTDECPSKDALAFVEEKYNRIQVLKMDTLSQTKLKSEIESFIDSNYENLKAIRESFLSISAN